MRFARTSIVTPFAGRAAAAVLVMAAACRSKPTPGSSCRVPDQLVCGGTDHALVCEPAPTGGGGATAWLEVPCKGARGCAKSGDVDECDDTVAQDGDPCPRNPPLDYACTQDRTKALVCKDGRFGLWRACRGPDACLVEGGRNVRCDTTLGEPGDPCGQQGTYACSVDHLWMLSCDGATLGPASSCRGPDGCRPQRSSRKVDCDDGVALEGDPCDQDKRITCALDHKAELVCIHGKYAKKRDCRRSDCRLDGNELYCD
jgi:hypothetical protein